MHRYLIPLTVVAMLGLSPSPWADELTRTIEADLAALGYTPGPVDGTETVETQIAISQFQADNNLEVTGKPSPQLAGIIKSRLNPQGATSAPAQPSVTDAEARRAAEQACLERKVAEARQAQERKKGLMSLMNSVSRTASRYAGTSDIARDVSETTRDIADANATKEDFEQAARDLGLSESDIESCRQAH